MKRLSVFDIYKIGVGPSSSHTLGPWMAALQFRNGLQGISFDRVEVHLFGSLSMTGIGHATDLAVQLGLEGHDPKKVDTNQIPFYIGQIKSTQQIRIHDREIVFSPTRDIIFERTIKPEHPNTLTFKAYEGGREVLVETFYSVGGGFIEKKGDIHPDLRQEELPYPIDSGRDLITYTDNEQVPISEIVARNELAFRNQDDIDRSLREIFRVMRDCIFHGCQTSGILPGGLNVKRRAAPMAKQLLGNLEYADHQAFFEAIKGSGRDFNTVNHWVNCFALAVNEENAAMGRIVTSPTNGAAGVIPAVLCYYFCFCDYKGFEDLRRFLYTSAEIGCIFKKKATISAAEGGCQAEIGVPPRWRPQG